MLYFFLFFDNFIRVYSGFWFISPPPSPLSLILLSPTEMLLLNKPSPYFAVFLFTYFWDSPSLIRVVCMSLDESYLLKEMTTTEGNDSPFQQP